MWLQVTQTLSVLIADRVPKSFCLLMTRHSETAEGLEQDRRDAQTALENMGFNYYICGLFSSRSSENNFHYHADVTRNS